MSWEYEDERWRLPKQPLFVTFCDEYAAPVGKTHRVKCVVYSELSIAERYLLVCATYSARDFIEGDGPATCKRCLRKEDA